MAPTRVAPTSHQFPAVPAEFDEPFNAHSCLAPSQHAIGDLDDRERKLDTAVGKMMLSLTTFSAELEREKARQRTRDAMLRKAKAGLRYAA